jgi:hypothetical protein
MKIGQLRQEIRTLSKILAEAWNDILEPMAHIEKHPDAANARVIYYFNGRAIEKGKLEGRLAALGQLVEGHSTTVDHTIEVMVWQLSGEIRQFMDGVFAENSSIVRNLMADAENNALREREKFRRR